MSRFIQLAGMLMLTLLLLGGTPIGEAAAEQFEPLRVNLDELVEMAVIGEVAHGYSNVAGHGPGITTLIASPTGNIEPYIDADANLATLLNLR